jgi:hypothetical protein
MRLPVVGQSGIGRPTIMDRTLAARFGVPYVHLAAFAIDVDRVYQLLEDDPELPNGWELFLTHEYCKRLVAPEHEPMIGAACEAIMHSEPALGSQLPFAIHALVADGAFPDLVPLFARWRKKAAHLEMIRECAERASTAALAARALDTPVDPPLAPPTRDALAQMAGR